MLVGPVAFSTRRDEVPMHVSSALAPAHRVTVTFDSAKRQAFVTPMTLARATRSKLGQEPLLTQTAVIYVSPDVGFPLAPVHVLSLGSFGDPHTHDIRHACDGLSERTFDAQVNEQRH